MSAEPASSSLPLVSVLVPAYNAERYIADTLRSISAQTFGGWEALVVDDGSTDATLAVARRFADADARIRVLRQPHGGVSAGRNTGIAAARGEFFALLDSDDVWKPDYLAEQLRILNQRPDIDILSANAVNVGGVFDGALWKRVDGGLHPVSLLTLIAVEDSICIMSIFRRQVVERIGGFDPLLQASEDYDFWLRAASRGCRIVFNAKPLGYYRRRADSLTADEDRMLVAVQAPLRKLRPGLPDSCAEAAALDAQLARFERELLAHRGKRALIAGDMAAARAHFRALRVHTRTVKHRAIAIAADRAPSLLRWVYALKRAG